MVLTPDTIVIIIAAGLFCGFLNAVASSGSAVSLPVLMSVGLHAVTANATNRVPVLVGAIAATVGLARRGAIPWRRTLSTAGPITLGAAAGALLSERIPGHDLRMVIVAAVAVALVLILTNLKKLLNSAAKGDARVDWKVMLLLFCVGVWTGFIVLDAGTYMLLVLVLAADFALPEANALRNVATATATAVAMAIFAGHESVDWTTGGIMALGSVAGGLLGARLAISEQARRWIVGLLIVVIVGELANLSIRYFVHLLH
ncbi:sulfite exporter TauE/SafE family protein [Caballeronia novacaledonica]|uniref:sulfite exporter TauE/SafE family protein n=1 Tax=Caballeronia novacaledonica TaxID=1544861 RepID=UPI001EE351ED|nr:sulfite exporter TauE/SafE family protein [Caballeronia novacaledonica]